MDKKDEYTAYELRRDQLIHRNFQLKHSRDHDEALLWLPDGVAWSLRRAIVANDESHFKLIKDVTYVHVIEPQKSNKAGPP